MGCLEAADIPPRGEHGHPAQARSSEMRSRGIRERRLWGSSLRSPRGALSRRGPPEKELLIEMGGNDPLVIMEDADLDAAVTAALSACFLNAG
jgi:acyl-CoA reductase-like NAD-dependent aldehyde dehydrogenase